MEIRKYREKDIPAMISIWNKVVEDGEAFPQEDFLNDTTVADLVAAQTLLAAVGILQTRVMLLITITEASILVKN